MKSRMQLFLDSIYFSDKCFVWAKGLGHPPPQEKVANFPENHVLGASDGPRARHSAGWYRTCRGLEQRAQALRTGCGMLGGPVIRSL